MAHPKNSRANRCCHYKFGVVLRCAHTMRRKMNSMFSYLETKLTPNPIHLTALYQLIHDLFSRFFSLSAFTHSLALQIHLSALDLLLRAVSLCVCISYSNMFASYLISSPAQSLTHTISHSCPHALALPLWAALPHTHTLCTRTHNI